MRRAGANTDKGLRFSIISSKKVADNMAALSNLLKDTQATDVGSFHCLVDRISTRIIMLKILVDSNNLYADGRL